MGVDDLGEKLGDLRKKAEDVVEEHEDAILAGIDRLADLVDDRTKGKHARQIDDGADKAKELVTRLADEGEKRKPKPKRRGGGGAKRPAPRGRRPA